MQELAQIMKYFFVWAINYPLAYVHALSEWICKHTEPIALPSNSNEEAADKAAANISAVDQGAEAVAA
jgi:hypothetical protein